MRVKRWHKFQHFKDRKPVWIKLYHDLLDDIEWYRLDGESAKLLVMMWLIASENSGELPPMDDLAFRLRITESKLNSVVTKLDHWLEQLDINTISSRYQLDTLEREKEREKETYKEEKETEKECRENITAPLKRSRSSANELSDEDWMQSIKTNPAYVHINVDVEYGKMTAWCTTKKRLPTRSRFLSWLNRIDKPMNVAPITKSQIPDDYASPGALRSLRIAEELRRQQAEVTAHEA